MRPRRASPNGTAAAGSRRSLLANTAAARAALDKFLQRSPVLTASDERLKRPLGSPLQRESFFSGRNCASPGSGKRRDRRFHQFEWLQKV